MQADPAQPVAGRPTRISLVVTEPTIGDPIREFDLVHDRLMHLVLVSEDLALFDHVHPALRDGLFSLTYTFPEAGPYKLWSDAKPKGSERILVAFRVQVIGEPVHRPTPVGLIRDFTQSVKGGRYRVALSVPDRIAAEKAVALTFTVRNEDGTAVTDLEPLMAAGGHCVIIRQDVRVFVHVHPAQEVEAGWRGGPDVTFETTFPTPGLYKIWGQFHHRGEVLTAAFVLEAR